MRLFRATTTATILLVWPTLLFWAGLTRAEDYYNGDDGNNNNDDGNDNNNGDDGYNNNNNAQEQQGAGDDTIQYWTEYAIYPKRCIV